MSLVAEESSSLPSTCSERRGCSDRSEQNKGCGRMVSSKEPETSTILHRSLFIHDFAVVAQPLHFLTRKNVPFRWTDECQVSFEELKRKLVSSPILALPSDEGQ